MLRQFANEEDSSGTVAHWYMVRMVWRDFILHFANKKYHGSRDECMSLLNVMLAGRPPDKIGDTDEYDRAE